MAGQILDPMPSLVDQAVTKAFPFFSSQVQRFQEWLNFTLIPRSQQSAPVTVGSQFLAQSAAIGTTALVGAANAGLYRISWWLRITQAAGVSSAVTVNILNTDGGIACTQSGAVNNGNTTATVEGTSRIVRADGGSLIAFTTTYASVGAPVANYDLVFRVEAL